MFNQDTKTLLDSCVYKNPYFSIEKRLFDLLCKMTLDEKIMQLQCIWTDKKEVLLDEDGKYSEDVLKEKLPIGIGQIGRLSDTIENLPAAEMAKLANKIQEYFVERTRLGIPVIFHEECLHGLAGPEATSYPQPIGLASTFNPELIKKVYFTIAEGVRKRGAHQALTPVLDVARDPRWGRVEETFGEDPHLVSEMSTAAIKGFQGDGDFSRGNNLIATLKHFAVHGQPESGTNCGPANYSERIVREVFLPPFKQAVEKAGARSIMASYNEIDGVPSHASKWLLDKVLKKEWGFNGTIVSDYYAITELYNKDETTGHLIAHDKKEAAKLAAEAGVNSEFPDPDCYPLLKELVESGDIDEALINDLVSPILQQKFELGLFDNPYVSVENIDTEKSLWDERQLAYEAAYESIVMLKNEDKTLPLKKSKISRIAVIGPNADREMLGGYSGKPKYKASVYEAINERVGKTIDVIYHEGCKITIGGTWEEDEVTFPDPADDDKLICEAVEIAKKADVVILVVGGNEQTSREAWNKKHLGDRTDLELFGAQNKLIKEISKLNKPTVSVMFNGRPLAMNTLNDNSDSILECWYLGQEGGFAIADVLFGEINPSGKLPISVPRSVGHLPCFYNYKPSARRGYFNDETTPLYPFGFGLSYTEFEMKYLKLSNYSIKKDETTSVSIEVTNTGDVAGAEVVQLYIRDKISTVTRPVKELKGFRKINLEAGQKDNVTFQITPDMLSFYDINMDYVVEPGEFEIIVSGSSDKEDGISAILNVE